jgi:flagellar basal-body rod modification protein FlgD
MAVSPVTTGTQQSTTQKSEAKLTADLQSFLTLLTTQLQHQDPLDPVDSTQFTSQLAQFAAVEQGIQTNANLETLIGLSYANQSLTAVTSYLGKYVEAVGNTMPLVDGTAHFAYSLPKAADAVVVQIKNEAGVTVASMTGETAAGKHDMTWDGKDSSGLQLPDGKYTFTVTAVDDKAQPIEAQTFTVGVVDAADGSGTDGVKVSINGVIVPLADIVAIKANAPSA